MAFYKVGYYCLFKVLYMVIIYRIKIGKENRKHKDVNITAKYMNCTIVLELHTKIYTKHPMSQLCCRSRDGWQIIKYVRGKYGFECTWILSQSVGVYVGRIKFEMEILMHHPKISTLYIFNKLYNFAHQFTTYMYDFVNINS